MIQWIKSPTQVAQAGLGGSTGQGWLNYLAETPCFYGNSASLVVVGRMSNLAPTLPDDPALLKALIAALQAENAKISFAGSLEPMA